jgi:hypothetical protein
VVFVAKFNREDFLVLRELLEAGKVTPSSTGDTSWRSSPRPSATWGKARAGKGGHHRVRRAGPLPGSPRRPTAQPWSTSAPEAATLVGVGDPDGRSAAWKPVSQPLMNPTHRRQRHEAPAKI